MLCLSQCLTGQVVVVLLNVVPFFQVLSAWLLELYPVVLYSVVSGFFGFVVSFLVIHTHLW